MLLQALSRHAGAFAHGSVPGVHFRALNAQATPLRSAWDAVVVQRGLGEPLSIHEASDGAIEAWAPLYPFLNLATLSIALRAQYAGRPLSRSIADELALAGFDASMYEASYGLHVRAAKRRGWPVQPLHLGFLPAVLLGAGRHARLLAMNLPSHVSSILTLAGINKSTARDLLVAHGLPVAPGGMASSPQAALRVARQLGGPVVIKRLVGGSSDGVIVGLEKSNDITSAARLLLNGQHAVLVESAVAGAELRLHFLSGKLHRAFLAEPFTVTGDGQRTLTQLIEPSYPRYLHVMRSSTAHRRRLVMCLWGLGVRDAGDLDHIVPEAGRRVRISAATGAGMQRVSPKTFLRLSDVKRLEQFLAHHGSPSCGIDLIVREARAPLESSCVILEINVPCGFAYLDKPLRAVADDLNAAIRGDDTFRKDKGRVPVWLVVQSTDTRLLHQAEAMMRKRHSRVTTGVLSATQSNWLSLVNQPDADALLISVSEEAIAAHGIPVNLAPRLIVDGERKAFVERHPVACATVKHAGGSLRAMEKPRR